MVMIFDKQLRKEIDLEVYGECFICRRTNNLCACTRADFYDAGVNFPDINNKEVN